MHPALVIVTSHVSSFVPRPDVRKIGRITVATEPKPCKQFRNPRLDVWVARVNSGKCKKCLELARYFERESRKNMFLWAHRN
jgi:hypothetical protein